MGFKLVNGQLVQTNDATAGTITGGYGSYGTYTNADGTTANIDKDAYNNLMSTNGENGLAKNFASTVGDWFTPQGVGGTSVGGNVLSGVGSAMGGLAGLAGAYYAGKNYGLQKDQQDYLKAREAQSDARKTQFAANVGGGASY